MFNYTSGDGTRVARPAIAQIFKKICTNKWCMFLPLFRTQDRDLGCNQILMEHKVNKHAANLYFLLCFPNTGEVRAPVPPLFLQPLET